MEQKNASTDVLNILVSVGKNNRLIKKFIKAKMIACLEYMNKRLLIRIGEITPSLTNFKIFIAREKTMLFSVYVKY